MKPQAGQRFQSIPIYSAAPEPLKITHKLGISGSIPINDTGFASEFPGPISMLNTALKTIFRFF